MTKLRMKWIVPFIVAVPCAIGIVCLGAEDKPGAAGGLKTTTDKITIPNSVVEFTLVQLPAGKITLKDKEGKDVEHAIKPIWIGQYEVTWEEYDIFWQALDLPEKDRAGVKSDKFVIRERPSVPYEPPDRGWGHDGWPAGSIWDREAKRYCEWLSAKTKHKYRLPTEAEWEYACRAGGPPVAPAENRTLKEVAWFEGNSDQQTLHVGKKKPNAWGLYDMLGNVGEWVILMDGKTALAGGSFQDEAADVHSGRREPFTPAWQKRDPQDPKGRSWLSTGPHAGFRLVRED